MEITLRLTLPRDASSVPVVRRILKHSLEAIKVDGPIIEDLELALTEACANVLNHSGVEEYEVVAGIDGATCVLEVIDRGTGFEPADPVAPPETAESGRGLLLIKAVSDKVSVTRLPAEGMAVRIEKQLVEAANS